MAGFLAGAYIAFGRSSRRLRPPACSLSPSLLVTSALPVFAKADLEEHKQHNATKPGRDQCDG